MVVVDDDAARAHNLSVHHAAVSLPLQLAGKPDASQLAPMLGTSSEDCAALARQHREHDKRTAAEAPGAELRRSEKDWKFTSRSIRSTINFPVFARQAATVMGLPGLGSDVKSLPNIIQEPSVSSHALSIVARGSGSANR